jgi:phosphopantothenoylcysteine decarboxylase/phosphopantothenate--cysteine ligase
MRDAVLATVGDQDVVVMAAAVSDFAPAAPATEKIKRGDSSLALELASTSDIAADAARANRHALHIGFALETGELVERAREKLGRKGQGMVVANAVTPDHNPFGSDTNRVALVTPDGVEELHETSKREVARHIWDAALALRPDLRKQDSADE